MKIRGRIQWLSLLACMLRGWSNLLGVWGKTQRSLICNVPFTRCSSGTPWKPLPSAIYERSLPKDPQGMWYESWGYWLCEDFDMQLTRSKYFFPRNTLVHIIRIFQRRENHENRHLQERGFCHMSHDTWPHLVEEFWENCRVFLVFQGQYILQQNALLLFLISKSPWCQFCMLPLLCI